MFQSVTDVSDPFLHQLALESCEDHSNALGYFRWKYL